MVAEQQPLRIVADEGEGVDVLRPQTAPGNGRRVAWPGDRDEDGRDDECPDRGDASDESSPAADPGRPAARWPRGALAAGRATRRPAHEGTAGGTRAQVIPSPSSRTMASYDVPVVSA